MARIAILGPNTTRYVDRGLTLGVTYTYAVKATSNTGASPLSGLASATP